MNIIERTKNVLITPAKEWPVIAGEKNNAGTIFFSYLLILIIIPMAASFIGYGLIGRNFFGVHVSSLGYGIRQAIVSGVSIAGGAFLSAFIINLLAEKFGAKKNFDRAFALVAYSYAAMCVAGILYIFPVLSILAGLISLYGLYILYLGIKPMMEVPEDKATTYFVVSLLCMIGAWIIIGAVLGAILIPRSSLMLGL